MKSPKKQKPNWEKIKAEYIKGGTSYRKLAEKYGVSLKAITNHAAKDKWIMKRQQVENNVDRAVVQQVSESKVETATQFLRLVDAMICKVEAAIHDSNEWDAASLRQLTLALKDLRDLKGLDKTELDREEQRARIDKLRHEVSDGETDKELTVRFVDTEGGEK